MTDAADARNRWRNITANMPAGHAAGHRRGTRVVRPFRTVRAVTVSFVLRLLDDHLRLGEVVGQAENVQTGERHVVGDVIELVEFLRRSNDGTQRDT